MYVLHFEIQMSFFHHLDFVLQALNTSSIDANMSQHISMFWFQIFVIFEISLHQFIQNSAIKLYDCVIYKIFY